MTVYLLELGLKLLIWLYGHPKVAASLEKVRPLTPDPNPPLAQENNPNLSNPPERGGIPR